MHRTEFKAMIRRTFACACVMSLMLGVAAAAAPLFRTAGGRNDQHFQRKAQQQVMKGELAEPKQRAMCLAISPDGHMLAAGCTDGLTYLLGPLSGEKKVTLAGVRRGYVRGVAFIPGRKIIAGIGDDDQLRFWDTTSGKMLKELTALGDLKHDGLPPLRASSLAVSPDGTLIAVGGSGTAAGSGIIRMDENSFFEIRIHDTQSGEVAWSKVVRGGFMHQLAFSPDSRFLASDTLDGVKLWDAKTGELKQTLKPGSGTVWALAFSPDNRLLAGCGTSAAEGKRIRLLTLWEVPSGAIVRSMDAGDAGGASAPGTLAFSPDGRSVASAWTGVVTGRISIGGGPVFMGSKVVNNVKLWDTTTGALIWTSAEGDYGDVTSLLFSPDGLSLYCCDMSATSRIDARTGQTRRDLMKAAGGQSR
jgi:WD40 repeat protein